MSVEVQRHNTAIGRPALSLPAKLLFQSGLVTDETSVLDYGCGRGDDVKFLKELGIPAVGWDPHFIPDPALLVAHDIVNLGFVLNVIENPEERKTVLTDAFALAEKCLSVSVMLHSQNDTVTSIPHRDGQLTAKKTFQKYYEQIELEELISNQLSASPIAAAPGVFFIFKDETLEQDFLLKRQLGIIQDYEPRDLLAKINEQKEKCKKQGMPYVYNRKWRDAKDLQIPKDIKPVIRFKSKISGNTIIKDLVQGERNISNSTIEDFVILRKDKSPTYQLSATVDDHEMNITHVIRGDDHMINSFKQKQIYDAMGWEVPNFAHIPLIHSEQGKKLSKRDNASTLEDYVKIGIISDALRNYLLRLGWSYKDKEIFTKQESIDLFDLSGVGKSPSKLDMSRILSINETYIKTIDEKDLFKFFKEYVSKYKTGIDQSKEATLIKSMGFLKNKAKTLEDIWNNAQYIIKDTVEIGAEDKKLIDDLSKTIIKEFMAEYEKLSSLSKETLEPVIKSLIEKHKTNFKGVGQPLRIALVGSRFGPGLYDVILSLDKAEIIKRLNNI